MTSSSPDLAEALEAAAAGTPGKIILVRRSSTGGGGFPTWLLPSSVLWSGCGESILGLRSSAILGALVLPSLAATALPISDRLGPLSFEAQRDSYWGSESGPGEDSTGERWVRDAVASSYVALGRSAGGTGDAGRVLRSARRAVAETVAPAVAFAASRAG